MKATTAEMRISQKEIGREVIRNGRQTCDKILDVECFLAFESKRPVLAIQSEDSEEL